jgi:hypothetical protein
VAIDSAPGVAALSFFESTFREKVVPPGDLTYHATQLHELFTAGKLFVLQDFNYAYPIVNSGVVKGKVLTAPLYYEKRQGSATGGWQMTVPKNAANIAGAKAWIKFVGTGAMDLDMALHYDPEPCWKSVFASPVLRKADPWLYSTWGYMFSRAAIPQVRSAGATAMYTDIAGIAEDLALGRISAAAAAKEMAKTAAGDLGVGVAS